MMQETYRSATLTVNLDAIADNWRLLCARHGAGMSAAVVKADAYGLGMIPVAKHLVGAGCDTFFVATLEEAVTLRQALAGVVIYVFQGCFSDEADILVEHQLRPVLNSFEQIARWQYAVVRYGAKAQSALHVDTGMCRLGITLHDLQQMDAPETLTDSCNITLLMSHMACASEPNHELNAKQRAEFDDTRQYFPGVPCSLANSSTHFLDVSYHYDLGRPGCSLYGITPNAEQKNPMRAVARWSAPIIQLRDIAQDQPIGYGATEMVAAGRKVAVVACGYADGVHRVASNQGLMGAVGDVTVPLLGRVSMDMLCFDVTDVPETLLMEQASVDIIGPHQTVDRVAEICHTIGYEIFTRIGARVRREYVTD